MNSKLNKVILAIVLFLTVFCAYPAYADNAKPASKGVRYKLAAMLPETGNLAFFGQQMRSALILANEQMRARLKESNIEVELIFADTQGNPREAVTQFSRVADIEKVNGIITVLSGIISAINPLAKDRDILFIGLTPDPTFLHTNPKGLRVLFSFDKEGTELADLVKERNWKRVLLLHSADSATTYEVSKVLGPKMKEDGVLATIDTFTVGQRDFKNLCAKYSGEKWDGVIYHGFGSDTPFLGEACSAYPNIAMAPKLGPLSTLDVKPDLRGNLTGIQFFAPAFLAKTSPEYEELSRRYAERFPGVTFSYSSVYAYDAYLLLTEALLKRATTKALTLKEELMTPKKALTQEYKFSQDGDFHPDTALLEISTDGSFKPARIPAK